MIHALKTTRGYFEDSAAGIKSFEVRKNDRPYSLGDYVALNEVSGGEYTGRCTLHKIVYILHDIEYCKDGYVILGLKPCAIRTHGELIESIRSESGVPIYERDKLDYSSK